MRKDYSDGSYYIGEVNGNEQCHGIGTCYYSNGAKYVGQWVNDIISGNGTFSWPHGDRYEGGFKDGKRYGYGTYYWSDGTKCMGIWENDILIGNATYCGPCGERYEGGWKDSKRHGHGINYWSDGTKCVGTWENNVLIGNATYYLNNGIKYVGKSKDYAITGKGILYWPDGSRYEGELKDGKLHGFGTCYWANGDKFVGEWIENEMTDRGTLYKKETNDDIASVKYVFVSYSTQNQDYAEAVRLLLKDEQISTWMAPYDIPAGSKYAHVINKAIKNCSCVLLLLSGESQKSEWVDKEIERAVSYKKTIIAMHLDESQLNDGFSFYLGNQQIIPVKDIDRNNVNVQKVLNAIKSFLI